ncbi:T9SS type A sorting domain-containing protein [Hymenobacter sp. ASUV-10]|uniref:T9SS type A sorting domain-containing protein n=1 Tax=Hymenobacter aranciens TaxID=3063996 RepID=A0ABT9B6D3_9BACT|nr:T9SS type A sorting domain-containing protein [Hymenobacter sp. ASUV-10]MDO7873825.1 T9SS type A sorting domain-containing protein [Hymenobacter sp. ASUV-10]
MKHLFLCLLAALLLGAGPAWALTPLSNVVVTNGQTTTFTGAAVAADNNYYSYIEIQSGGTGVFNDAEYVSQLLVRTGGTLVFGSLGQVRTPGVTASEPPTPSITLEPGAAVQLATPAGLPFAQGDYFTNSSGGNIPSTAYTLTLSPDARYTFNGTTAQTTAAPAPRPSGGTAAASANGVALPATVGRLTLSNSAGLTLVNSTGVSQELHLTNGQLTLGSGATLTLLSSAAGTALAENQGGGTLLGPLTVQRYIDGSRNAGVGYRHLSAPLGGTTVASFANGSFTPRVNPAYNTNPAAVPAASFPTVFSYREARVGGAVGPVGFDQGWESPNALSDFLSLGLGYTVHTPAGGTMSFTGSLATATINRTGLGHTAAGGYHLLGNPYPAPLDWDLTAAATTGMNRTLYVFKSTGPYTGFYTTYLPSAPTGANTGSRTVPVGQGFFVYNPTLGTTGQVSFLPSQAYTSVDAAAAPAVQRSTADLRPYLRLTLHDAAATQQHETLVYFDPAATAGLDNDFDSPFLPGPGQPLSLSTELAGQQYSTNGLPALGTTDVTVPLRLSATAAGLYQLQVAALAHLPAGTRAYLLDATAGTRQELTATSTIGVALPAGQPVAGRYSLLFSSAAAPLASAPAALAALASLYPNPASGTATLRLPAALRAGQPTTVRVLDALGRVVATATQPAAAAEFTLPLTGLAPGTYTVQAQAAGGTVARRLTVQ